MTRAIRFLSLGLFGALAGSSGCSSDIIIGIEENSGGGSSGSSGGSSASSGGAAGHAGGNSGGAGGGVHGVECPDIGLTAAGFLTNVVGRGGGKNVRIQIEPHDEAVDYRVYALPKRADVSGDTVQNATYRCAGNYEVPAPTREDDTPIQSSAVRTRIDSVVQGVARVPSDATLGYVFATPGPDRVPVYALGDPTYDPSGASVNGDNVDCFFMRWPESRVKRYTTSEAERSALLDAHWRDDGIVFHAPKAGAAGTHAIYLSDPGPGSAWVGPLYVREGPEYEARKAGGEGLTPAFSAYSDDRRGAAPLMRVHYEQLCARAHDELVVGLARFRKAYEQGSQPIAELHWSGLEEETTLVVEAVDRLCPFQGILSPEPRPPRIDSSIPGVTVDYPAFLTVNQIRAAAPAGEVYVNGQGDAGVPRAVARACIDVAPAEQAVADWRYDGGEVRFGAEIPKRFQTWDVESEDFYAELVSTATDEWAIGSVFGELWVTWADWGAGSNGLFRLTPKTRAEMSSGAFLHATMEVDTVSTERRFPQMLISDRDWPVEQSLADGRALVVQTRHGTTNPTSAEIQLCDHTSFDGGVPCPRWDLWRLNDGADFLAPRPEMNGLAGVDRTVLFDVYASTERVYLYVNGVPYGCVDLPAGGFPSGPVTVTFGDVLFVSMSDLTGDWYPFHSEHMPNITSRHFSNLTFTSGVGRPSWNEARHPCVPSSGLER